MLTTILSVITVLAAVGVGLVSGKAKRRMDAELEAAVTKSESMLAEMRAIRDKSALADAQVRARQEHDSENELAAWTAELAAVSAKLRALRDRELVIERDVDEAQFFRDRMVSVLSIRGSGAERLTDVDGRWLLERDASLAKSLRATRRRDRGIPQSRELPGWAVGLR